MALFATQERALRLSSSTSRTALPIVSAYTMNPEVLMIRCPLWAVERRFQGEHGRWDGIGWCNLFLAARFRTAAAEN